MGGPGSPEASLLAGRHRLPRVHTRPSLRASVASPPYQDTSHTGLGCTHMTSFALITPEKTLSQTQPHSEALAGG